MRQRPAYKQICHVAILMMLALPAAACQLFDLSVFGDEGAPTSRGAPTVGGAPVPSPGPSQAPMSETQTAEPVTKAPSRQVPPSPVSGMDQPAMRQKPPAPPVEREEPARTDPPKQQVVVPKSTELVRGGPAPPAERGEPARTDPPQQQAVIPKPTELGRGGPGVPRQWVQIMECDEAFRNAMSSFEQYQLGNGTAAELDSANPELASLMGRMTTALNECAGRKADELTLTVHLALISFFQAHFQEAVDRFAIAQSLTDNSGKLADLRVSKIFQAMRPCMKSDYLEAWRTAELLALRGFLDAANEFFEELRDVDDCIPLKYYINEQLKNRPATSLRPCTRHGVWRCNQLAFVS